MSFILRASENSTPPPRLAHSFEVAFNNVRHLNAGWNLSARVAKDSGASRAYFAVGVSLREVVGRLTP